MTTPRLMRLTPYGLVRSLAVGFDMQLTDEQVAWILWERTAFMPAGDGGDLPHIARQVRRYFEYHRAGYDVCARCGRSTEVGDDLCEPCVRDGQMEMI